MDKLEKAIEDSWSIIVSLSEQSIITEKGGYALRTVIEAAEELIRIRKDTALAPKHFKTEEGGKE